ncbi:MAG TPA: hypothetical protein VFN10_14375 [Thermoanaerobaculia bacterium]|nr:hypothetical protein [Thermoanaerobaculia bacterium]
MTAVPGELTASAVVSLIRGGAYPREVVATIARGFLPLEQQELIGVLAYLSNYEDPEIPALAKASLAEIPPRVVLEFAMNEAVPADQLANLLRAGGDNIILEALIRNRAVPDEAIVELAKEAGPALQDVIVINQARILRAPEILESLLANPQLTPDARRRALETREEFFEKKARLAQLELEEEVVEEEPPLPENLSLEAIADLLEKAAAEPEDNAPVAIDESEKKDPKKFAVWARVAFMSVSEKVQLAFKGDRSARLVLVRDRNRLVCSAVMRNPRLTDQEVDNIAGMRNVDSEVLRLIGMKKDWMGKYNIMLTLCRNPKAPVGLVLTFINRLTLRDLKGLKDDKGVSQAVRDSARRLFQNRSTKG